MRGYSEIMNTSDSPSVELHGNGQRVTFPDENEGTHTLWEQKFEPTTPIWHLRITAFKTLEDVTRAVNQVEAAFGNTFDLKKCGIDSPDAMGGRVNDGRSENITIEFDSNVAKESWTEFLARLKVLENEWSHVPEVSNL
ncbi:hypothetical protein NHQ30_011545 [Ciborinia camelliae]|nr:hypothetical protein NHQ30_011545 [Ciborinia camelliae]